MQNTEAPAPTGGRNAATPHTPCVAPELPLLLLETMRDMDRPEEVLEGEEFSVSMPRRLGLSDVVFAQIGRFTDEVKRKRLQAPATVEDLIKLVIRRPDAEEIFLEAGRRLARRAWDERSSAARRFVRLLPPALAQRSAARAVDRLFRRIAGDGTLRVTRAPVAVRIDGALTVRGDEGGAACLLYAGVLAEVLHLYTGAAHAGRHDRCAARGAETCEWTAAAQA
jgi:predicted hydrocarbon binding protein